MNINNLLLFLLYLLGIDTFCQNFTAIWNLFLLYLLGIDTIWYLAMISKAIGFCFTY